MRHSKLLIGLAAVLVVAGFAWVRHVDNNLGTCDPDASGEKDTCTAAIDSGYFSGDAFAPAYALRGEAFLRKGDLVHAIDDFNEAIRLDPKNAQAYGGRGFAYARTNDLVRAMADLNEAIRLDPQNSDFHWGRGAAYAQTDDFDRALADFKESLRLNPQNAAAYYARGYAYFYRDDFGAAISDYDEAIRLDPKNAEYYLYRGIARFYSGDVSAARADFIRERELDPKDAYSAIWDDIVARHNGEASRLSEAVSAIDMTAWPAPVIRALLQQTATADTLAPAAGADEKQRMDQTCEADFYSGEMALRQKDKADARRLFRRAVEGCPKHNIETVAARAELKTLDAAP